MSDQDIALVRRARPADTPHDPAAKARAWARLHAEFEVPALARPRRPRRRLAVVGLVAAGTAVAIAVTQTGRPAPSKAPARDQTVRTLELAAEHIERQTVPRPRPDQWIYSPELTDWADAPAGTLHGKIKVERWWRFDGTEIVTSTQGSPLETQHVLRPGEKPPPGTSGPVVSRTSPRRLYDYVATLPADPDALLSQIRRDTKDSGQDLATFGQIVHILNDDKLIPPQTNAAIYRALAKIPGVKVVTGVKDFAGRPGIAVTRTAQGLREELILDGNTYRFLGVQTSGRIASATADLDWRVVDRPGQR